jgi:hypothetical protein
MKGEVVVYTVVTGAYDRLRPARGKATWLCFTDGSAEPARPWDFVKVPACRTVDERIRQARRIKTLPHLFLPPHAVSVWIDANLELRVSPRALTKFVGREPLATFAYPDTYGHRDCAYQEARACILRGKDDRSRIEAQMNRYRDMGFPEHAGLAETSIVVRRDTPECRALGELWWAEISKGSRRDQLSFNFACWRTGMRYAMLPGSRVKNPFTFHRPHEQQVYGHHGRLHG